MKKILFFCFIIQLFFSVYSENNLKSLIPDYVISNEEFKKIKDEYGLYCLKYGYDVMSIEKVKDEPEYMNSRKINQLIKDNKLSVKNILELYEKGESFVLIRLFPMSVEETSNELISVDGKIVGETTFDASSDGKLASNTFGFTMKFIDDRMIHHFWINFIISKDYEDEFYGKLPGIFTKKDGYWYWNETSSVAELFNLMKNHDKNLPEEFLKLQDTWETIVNNLKIKGVKIKLID